ncbi:unnamed protein product [Lasius platythorax]|uniref:Uncharacterized protein n=1 Tax=Lasius platythorax TaxID=488582 RepID=A0AAV2PBM7_9HYME
MAIQAEFLDGRVEDEELAPQVQVGVPLVGTRHSSSGQALQSASHDLRPPRRPSIRHRDLLDHPRVLRAPGLTPRRRRPADDHWEDPPRFTPVDPTRGDGGGSRIHDDLGSDLVELRDVLPLMLLLATFRLHRSAYAVLDVLVDVVARSVQ